MGKYKLSIKDKMIIFYLNVSLQRFIRFINKWTKENGYNKTNKYLDLEDKEYSYSTVRASGYIYRLSLNIANYVKGASNVSKSYGKERDYTNITRITIRKMAGSYIIIESNNDYDPKKSKRVLEVDTIRFISIENLQDTYRANTKFYDDLFEYFNIPDESDKSLAVRDIYNLGGIKI